MAEPEKPKKSREKLKFYYYGKRIKHERKCETEIIKQEFTDRFPYLRLSIYASSQKGKSSKTPLDSEKTIAEVREKNRHNQL